MRFGIGQPVTRKEDRRFLTGRARYVADLDLPRQAYAAIVYSPHAHARIRGIDTSAAAAMPGVYAVLTGADWAQDGLGALEPEAMADDRGVPLGIRTAHFPLALDRVRYVGERVALVVAASEAQAQDAAERVMVDYQPLPAVTTTEAALRPGAPLIHDGAAGNVSFTMRMGNAEAVAAAFARARHVTRLSLYNNRLTAVTMEPRGCLADYDPGTGRYTLYTSTQAVHRVRQVLAEDILHCPENRIRVIARDVGGGFGMKVVYPEDALMVWAARRLGRPVKWIATRAEAFLGDMQGRDQRVSAELALDGDGRFLALRWTGNHNIGAYVEGAGAIPLIFSLKLAPTVYAIPAVAVESSLVFTNTAPTHPYRGAGRPEAVYLMERLVDQAARETGIDPAELRRRNLIGAEQQPYATPTGWVYDSGDYAAALARCQALADWDGFAARRAASLAAGKYRGRGLTYYLDNTGVFNERMELRFDPSGEVTVVAGTLSHGQGHETVYAQMVADWLGIDADKIHLAQADTDEVAIGRGTYASRSMMAGAAPCAPPPTKSSSAAGALPRIFSKPTPPTSYSPTASSRSPAPTARCRSPRSRKNRSSRSGCPRNWGSDCRGRAVFRSACRAFPMAATSARSKSTPKPGLSRSTATSWSMIAAGFSTHYWQAGRSRAASPRVPARHCSRMWSMTRRAASC